MSATTLDTSTWAMRPLPGASGTRGAFRAATGRSGAVHPNVVASDRSAHGWGTSIYDAFVPFGAALGAKTPARVKSDAQKRQDFLSAFMAGAELAQDMVAADELDSPDPDVWNFAMTLLGEFHAQIPPPLVTPLQLGGVSCEWHDAGMNIEFRFRRIGAVYLLVEDARNQVAKVSGGNADLPKALAALLTLSSRLA